MFTQEIKEFVISFKTKEGKDILCKLLKKSNILIENFVPGTMENGDLIKDF